MRVIINLIMAAAAARGSQVGIFVPLYNNQTQTDWRRVAAAAASGVPVSAVVIAPGLPACNPQKTAAPAYPSNAAFAAGLAALRKAGVVTYGYVHTRDITQKCCVCCSSLPLITSWIESTARFAYDGIMVDNGFDTPEMLPFYTGVFSEVRRARAVDPPLRLAFNAPLTALARDYVDTVDLMNIGEEAPAWLAPGAPTWKPPGFMPEYPPGRYAVIVGSCSNASICVSGTVNAAKTRGIKWVYVTDASDALYNRLPPYWDSLVEEVQRANDDREA